MPIDPLTGLEEDDVSRDLEQYAPSQRLESDSDRTHSVKELGLDHLVDYEGFDGLDIENTNMITQDVNKMRAEAQSHWAQALNGIAGGVASGLMTAVEDASYILDFEAHSNAIQGIDDWERNSVAEWAISMKEGIDETMPIYRESDKTFDWTDSGFYWGSLKGVIDSAVGFGLPGGAIAKGVGTLTKIAKIEALVGMLSKTDVGINLVNAGLSGYINNHAEGTMMGLETYDNVMLELKDSDLSIEQQKTIAGQAANEMRSQNRAMILTDAFSMYGLTKGTQATRNILKEKGFKNRFKEFGKTIYQPNADNVILQGAKEAGEEITQNVIQMESEYQAKVKAKEFDDSIDLSYAPEDISSRLKQFALSDQALLEGMMGFVGGGPQRILSEVTSGRHTKSAKQAYSDRYNAQQQTMSANGEYLSGSMELYAKRVEEANQLRKAGEDELADAVLDGIRDSRIIANLENGTTEEFEKQLESIAAGQGTDKEQQATGKDQAGKYLERLRDLEKEWIRHSNHSNVSEIVRNRSNKREVSIVHDNVVGKLNDKVSELDDVVKSIILPKYKDRSSSKTSDKDTYIGDMIYDLSNLEGNPHNKTKEPKAHARYERFKSRVEKEVAYKELQDIKEAEGKIRSQLDDIQKDYSRLKDGKAATNYEKRIGKVIEDTKVEKQMREDFIQNEDPDIVPEVGGIYSTTNGKPFKYMGLTKDGRPIIAQTGAKSGNPISPEKFQKMFMPNGALTVWKDKETVNQEIKETGAKANNKEVTKKVKTENTPSKEDEVIANSPIDTKEDVSDIEPQNETKEVLKKEESKVDNKSEDPTSLAWVSVNNTRAYSKYDKSVEQKEIDAKATEYLEEKNNSIVGKEVTIEFNRDFDNKIVSNEDYDFIENADLNNLDEAGQKILANVVASGAIRATLNENPDVVSNLHLPDFIDASDSDYGVKMETLRLEAIKAISKSVNNIATSNIDSKSKGSVVFDNELKNVKATLQEDNANNIELSIRYSDGNLYTGEELLKDVDGSLNTEAPKGTVFVTIPTANETKFPLRLNVRTVNTLEAVAVLDIYKGYVNKEFTPKSVIDESQTPGLMSNDQILDVAKTVMDINGYVELSDVSVGEILNELVYQGEQSLEGKFPLDMNKGKVTFGTSVMPIDLILKDPSTFIEWLSNNKIRNISFKSINNKKYKDYLLDTEILKTNAIGDKDGVKFVQPTIKISNNIKSNNFTANPMPEAMVAEQPDVEQNSPDTFEDGMSEVTISDDAFAKMIAKHKDKVSDDKTIEDSKESEKDSKLAAEDFSVDVDVTSNRIETIQNDLLNKYPGKTSLASLHDIYDGYSAVLSAEDALDLAIKDYEEVLKKCK